MKHVIANEKAYQDYKNTLKAVLIILARSNTMEEALKDLQQLEKLLYNAFIKADNAANAKPYYDEQMYDVADTAYNADTVVDAIITYATDVYIQFPTDFMAACFTPTFLC